MDIKANTFIGNFANITWPSSTNSNKLVAKGLGGAIYYDCLNEGASLNHNCIVNIKENNIFENNTALNDGGAILWVSNRFNDDGTTVFKGNTASYGNDIASYPD